MTTIVIISVALVTLLFIYTKGYMSSDNIHNFFSHVKGDFRGDNKRINIITCRKELLVIAKALISIVLWIVLFFSIMEHKDKRVAFFRETLLSGDRNACEPEHRQYDALLTILRTCNILFFFGNVWFTKNCVIDDIKKIRQSNASDDA